MTYRDGASSRRAPPDDQSFHHALSCYPWRRMTVSAHRVALPRFDSTGEAAVALSAALLAFAVTAFAPQVLNDGDTFLHIAAGRRMLVEHAILFRDPFSYTFAGAPWQAHEWLAEIFMALAYQAGGWSGLIGLFAVAAAADGRRSGLSTRPLAGAAGAGADDPACARLHDSEPAGAAASSGAAAARDLDGRAGCGTQRQPGTVVLAAAGDDRLGQYPWELPARPGARRRPGAGGAGRRSRRAGRTLRSWGLFGIGALCACTDQSAFRARLDLSRSR